jgi:hypothetical protein
MSKNVVEPERPQVAIWRMRVECWISKATRAQAHASARAPTLTHAGVLFLGSSGFGNAPQCCIIRTLPVLLTFEMAYGFPLRV